MHVTIHIMSNPTAKSVPMAPGAGNEASLPASNIAPSLDHLITDDGRPVDNFFVEKQQRLLTEPLNSSWTGPEGGRPFIAASNVGLFFEPKNPAYCPDAMLSLGVRLGDDLKQKPNRSYFVWLLGKVPDVVIEIVSDRTGGEDGHKMQEYARQGIPYYVIFDPAEHLSAGVLRVFGCRQGAPMSPCRTVGLHPRAWAFACGKGSTRTTKTSGCAGVTALATSFRAARKRAKKRPNAPTNCGRNCGPWASTHRCDCACRFSWPNPTTSAPR